MTADLKPSAIAASNWGQKGKAADSPAFATMIAAIGDPDHQPQPMQKPVEKTSNSLMPTAAKKARIDSSYMFADSSSPISRYNVTENSHSKATSILGTKLLSKNMKFPSFKIPTF